MSTDLCSVPECGRRRKYRLLCGTHYERMRTTGSLDLAARPSMCAEDECGSDVLAKGLCSTHYHRSRRPSVLMPTLKERLLAGSAVDESGCQIWQGAPGLNGYGRLSIDGRLTLAHRASYEAFVGPIPSGLTIDHLCRVRMCINPEHLEPVTRAENTRRELEVRYSA